MNVDSSSSLIQHGDEKNVSGVRVALRYLLLLSWFAAFAAMSCCAVASPPPFLSTPGQTVVAWPQWKLAFLNYLEAVGGEKMSAIRRKAILLNALGLEGQRMYCSITGDSRLVLTTQPSTATGQPEGQRDVSQH